MYIASMDASKKPHADLSSLDKGELHVHLNGLVPAPLVREILQSEGAEVPRDFDLALDLVRRTPCASLNRYLKPWQVLRLIPSQVSNLQRISDEAFTQLKANNVKFVELRSSVLYLATLQKCLVREALTRLIEATRISAIKHAITRGIILTVPRGDYSVVHFDALLTAYRDLGCPGDVVGLDLAGDEGISYPNDLPLRFRSAKAKYGLGVTVHAGETGHIENILTAVNEFQADRIGHGTAAGSNPAVMDTLCRQDVCVEVCPISNRLTGAVKTASAHPLNEFRRRGVPFVICSDNPGIHERGLNADFEVAASEGLDIQCLHQQFDLAKRYAFLGSAA
jgi:adenosine deaminase